MTKTFTGTVTSCTDIVNSDNKQVYTCTIEFPRRLTQDLIDVGASVGIFAENMEEDVLAVLEAF